MDNSLPRNGFWSDTLRAGAYSLIAGSVHVGAPLARHVANDGLATARAQGDPAGIQKWTDAVGRADVATLNMDKKLSDSWSVVGQDISDVWNQLW